MGGERGDEIGVVRERALNDRGRRLRIDLSSRRGGRARPGPEGTRSAEKEKDGAKNGSERQHNGLSVRAPLFQVGGSLSLASILISKGRRRDSGRAPHQCCKRRYSWSVCSRATSRVNHAPIYVKQSGRAELVQGGGFVQKFGQSPTNILPLHNILIADNFSMSM